MKTRIATVVLVLLSVLAWLAKAQVNSPALQSYQELLKAGDEVVTRGTYACFYDDPQITSFMLISALMMSKDSMTVFVSTYKDGISSGTTYIYGGKLKPISSSQMIFADLPTQMNSPDPTHNTDLFSWAPDVLSIRRGFGNPGNTGILRVTDEFRMQRSTGRFTRDITSQSLPPDKSGADHYTGKCIRVPGTSIPEDAK